MAGRCSAGKPLQADRQLRGRPEGEDRVAPPDPPQQRPQRRFDQAGVLAGVEPEQVAVPAAPPAERPGRRPATRRALPRRSSASWPAPRHHQGSVVDRPASAVRTRSGVQAGWPGRRSRSTRAHTASTSSGPRGRVFNGGRAPPFRRCGRSPPVRRPVRPRPAGRLASITGRWLPGRSAARPGPRRGGWRRPSRPTGGSAAPSPGRPGAWPAAAPMSSSRRAPGDEPDDDDPALGGGGGDVDAEVRPAEEVDGDVDRPGGGGDLGGQGGGVEVRRSEDRMVEPELDGPVELVLRAARADHGGAEALGQLEGGGADPRGRRRGREPAGRPSARPGRPWRRGR